MCSGPNEYDTGDGCACDLGYLRDQNNYECRLPNVGDSLNDINTVYNIAPGDYGTENFTVQYTSDSLTMSISTGEYRINGGAWTSHTVPASVANDDVIDIRMSPTAMDQRSDMEINL